MRAVRGNRIPVAWCAIPNWGDALNPYLVRKLSGRDAQHVEGLHHDRYLVVGSVLGAANRRAEVWGSGLIREGERLREEPKAIHAVRGPLSRQGLRRQGFDCPEIYGDPALLMPLVYDPEVEKIHQVGIVAHYVDKCNPWVEQWRAHPSVRVINVEGETEEFVREIKSCEVVLSSSLHGLICADAYGVPNMWIKLSDKVIGGAFKFNDYRLSLGLDEVVPPNVSQDLCPMTLAADAEVHRVTVDLRRLMLACPFLSDNVRQAVSRLTADVGCLRRVLRRCDSGELSAVEPA